jgi:hypothetical protein
MHPSSQIYKLILSGALIGWLNAFLCGASLLLPDMLGEIRKGVFDIDIDSLKLLIVISFYTFFIGIFIGVFCSSFFIFIVFIYARCRSRKIIWGSLNMRKILWRFSMYASLCFLFLMIIIFLIDNDALKISPENQEMDFSFLNLSVSQFFLFSLIAFLDVIKRNHRTLFISTKT